MIAYAVAVAIVGGRRGRRRKKEREGSGLDGAGRVRHGAA